MWVGLQSRSVMVTVETAFIKLGVSWSVALEEDEAGRILVPRSSRQGKKANPMQIEKRGRD